MTQEEAIKDLEKRIKNERDSRTNKEEKLSEREKWILNRIENYLGGMLNDLELPHDIFLEVSNKKMEFLYLANQRKNKELATEIQKIINKFKRNGIGKSARNLFRYLLAETQKEYPEEKELISLVDIL